MEQNGILVMNVGSTSCKIKYFTLPDLHERIGMKFERLGGAAPAECTVICGGKKEKRTDGKIRTYKDAIDYFLGSIDRERVVAVGFKTVLSTLIAGVGELTEEVVQDMRALGAVCPAHNLPYADAVEQCREALPKSRMIGSFETGFHQTIELHRRIYGLPYDWLVRYGIQKNGFHGASHEYAARFAQSKGCARAICCHLGGSSSVCAVLNGKSFDISFGFSPQSGVMQLYRAGDTDCAIIPWLRRCGLTEEEINEGFAKKGGMRGISGVEGDLRDILADGSERAELAVKAYAHSVVRYIGAFYAELQGLDCITFSGGIGENSAKIRGMICSQISHFGVSLDEERNLRAEQVISSDSSPVRVFILPADEESIVAEKVARFIGA